MFWVKEHKSVLAICDEEVIGKTFEDGNKILQITEKFYKGRKIDEKELIECLKAHDNINIVGENSINQAKKIGFVKTIQKIKKIPYAIVFKM